MCNDYAIISVRKDDFKGDKIIGKLLPVETCEVVTVL